MKTPDFIESFDTGKYDFCDRVIDRLEYYISGKDNPETSHHFMDGRETNGIDKRKDFSFNFSALKDPLNIEMHDILREYVPKYLDMHPGFSMQSSTSEAMKVQKTPPKGGFHTWHCEHGIGDASNFRNLTWTLYLNNIPEGEGETEFLEYGVKVQPEKGKLSLFPAAWTHTHRGNPVYSCTKYIATGWYYMVG
tara:strand:- start:771 stop:1349 length:579 start_codon:yes stop_codon:yes gene_type:complete